MEDAIIPPGRFENNNATPTRERAVASYPARRSYKPYIQRPPHIDAVSGMIDIHCHAEHGQQDALAVAKLASESGMYGILYKSIGKEDKRTAGPMEDVRRLLEDLDRWSDETGIAPIKAWGGYALCRDGKPPNSEKVTSQIKAGVSSFWLALANHANTFFIVGGKVRRWDPNADPKAHSDPLPWDLALKYGHYALDEKGRLKPEYDEAIRMIADSDCALSFGHSTHQEISALAELVDKLKFKRAFIDHPVQPFRRSDGRGDEEPFQGRHPLQLHLRRALTDAGRRPWQDVCGDQVGRRRALYALQRRWRHRVPEFRGSHAADQRIHGGVRHHAGRDRGPVHEEPCIHRRS